MWLVVNDLGLLVVGALLTFLVQRTWGHRRLLHQVREQLEVLAVLPHDWKNQRRTLQDLAEKDMAKYVRARTPNFPAHRLMNALLNVSFVGVVLFMFAREPWFPGPEWLNEALALAGAVVALAAVVANMLVLIARRKQVDAELQRSADTG